MENYHLTQDLTLYGFPVETFPEHIQEAFDKLINLLPPEDSRPYYGISKCTPAGIEYVAAAPLKPEDLPEQYGLQTYQMEQGDYLAVTVKDWRTKTHTIKSIFEKMVADPSCDVNKPCVEIYLNDDEMLCLVKALTTVPDAPANIIATELKAALETTLEELHQQFTVFEDEEINVIPYAKGWTAGQVAEHLVICNSGFVEIITGPVTETNRQPDALINQMKADFLNFSFKMNASEFVWPQDRVYQKTELLQSFRDIQNLLSQAILTLDLTKTCLALDVPVYGYLTRLEAVHFVIYHTQRHIQQLIKIQQHLIKQAVKKMI